MDELMTLKKWLQDVKGYYIQHPPDTANSEYEDGCQAVLIAVTDYINRRTEQMRGRW